MLPCGVNNNAYRTRHRYRAARRGPVPRFAIASGDVGLYLGAYTQGESAATDSGEFVAVLGEDHPDCGRTPR
jgi:hypothetical protein